MTTGHSSARQRLLETASELFYREGIRAIGVDTMVPFFECHGGNCRGGAPGSPARTSLTRSPGSDQPTGWSRDPEQLADQLLLVVNGALASASLFSEASPAHQLKTIAAHLINLQLESAQTRS